MNREKLICESLSSKSRVYFFLVLDILVAYFYIYPLWDFFFWLLLFPFAIFQVAKLWKHSEIRPDWIRFKSIGIPVTRIASIVIAFVLYLVLGDTVSIDEIFKLIDITKGAIQGIAWAFAILTYILSILYIVVIVDDLIKFLRNFFR